MTDQVSLSLVGPAAEIVFNAPARRNAFNQAMWAALPGLISEAEAAPSTRAVILHGGDTGHFAAGADISEFETVYADESTAARSAETIDRALAAIEACSKPVIAAIEGVCIGGGVSIALAADYRIASIDARFGVTPARLGLVYPFRDTERLVAAVGPSHAKDILFTASIFDAKRAVRIGLIGDTCQSGHALHEAREKTAAIAAVAASSVCAMKRIVNGLMSSNDGVEQAGNRQLFLEAVAGDDFKEGYRAFLEKRKPKFPNR